MSVCPLWNLSIARSPGAGGRGDFLYIPQQYIHCSSCSAWTHTHTRAHACTCRHKRGHRLQPCISSFKPTQPAENAHGRCLYMFSTAAEEPTLGQTSAPPRAAWVCVSFFHLQWKSLKPNKLPNKKKMYELNGVIGKRLRPINYLHWSI